MRLLAGLAVAATGLAQTPIDRAIGYLAAEVEKWPRENGCYSCHNNGDAVRALLAAKRLGFGVRDEALAGSLTFLARPEKWDAGKESPFNDKRLARLQFTAALADAARDGLAPKPVFDGAIRELIKLQEKNGSWRVEPDRDPGAPATWGTALATALSLRVLEQAGTSAFDPEIRRARDWIHRAEPRYTVDRAALAMAGASKHVAPLLAAQTSDGGWGPIPKTPAEVFDTAIVLLAIDDRQAIERGREFLLKSQQPMGGWPETTRPSGSQSYAEHISTTAWATLALLLTDPKR